MSFVRESTPLEKACTRIVLELLLEVIDWDEATREAAPYGLTPTNLIDVMKQFRGLAQWELMRFAEAYGARLPFTVLWDPVTEEYLTRRIAEKSHGVP